MTTVSRSQWNLNFLQIIWVLYGSKFIRITALWVFAIEFWHLNTASNYSPSGLPGSSEDKMKKSELLITPATCFSFIISLSHPFKSYQCIFSMAQLLVWSLNFVLTLSPKGTDALYEQFDPLAMSLALAKLLILLKHIAMGSKRIPYDHLAEDDLFSKCCVFTI